MTGAGHSVLLVPVPELERFVRSRWEHYDPALVSADPDFTHAHITLLGPWLTDPSPDDLAAVGSIAAGTRAFGFGLSEVAAFPDGTVHLRPEPAEPFTRLTARLWDAFPQCPPYAGQFAAVEPHLTLDQVGPGVTVESTRSALADDLPASCAADRIELHWYETGGCHVQHRWPLAQRQPESLLKHRQFPTDLD